MSSKDTIEFEGIEFKCFSLIEYTSLCQLLKLLAKKYKDLEKKMGILDGRMIEKDKRISELEVMLKGASQSKDDKFPSIQSDPSKSQSTKNKEEKRKEKEKMTSDDDFLNDDNDDKDKNKENGENKEKDENGDNLSDQNKGESQRDLNKSSAEDKDDNEKDKEDNEDNGENKNIENGGRKDENEENLNQVYSPGKATTTNLKKIESTEAENKNDYSNIEDSKKLKEQQELINKILKKLKTHDKQINDLTTKSNEHNVINKNIKKNKNDIEDLNKRFNLLKNSIDDINNKLLKFNEDFDSIKVKVQDFNVYDLFKGGDSDGGNLDAAKILIMNLENKVFKKFDLFDERNKKMDKDFFKMQEDVKNALAAVDGIKTNTQRNTDSINELNDNYNKTTSNYETLINEIQKRIEEIYSKVNSEPDYSGLKEEIYKKIKELEDKLNSKIDSISNKQLGNKEENEKPSSPTLRAEDLAMIKDLRRRIGELEKFVNASFDKINAEDMRKSINALEAEMPKKASKYELNELKEKVKSLDDFAKDLNFKVDSLQQFTEKVRQDLAQIIKKIEFLSGEYSKLAFKSIGGKDEGKGPVVDMSKFLDLNTFNENKKDVNNKFEKVRLGFEDLSREIEEILSKLAHTPTDKDFAEFQNIIKNLLDEFKISCNKKYADKFDTAKSIKFLETQIKSIHESYSRRSEGGDNWLLAKKPLNNFVCASCEAKIRGELDKRTEYIPWNKYPQREDKAYRLGHGFSRMLQMVNEDIIRSAGEKGYSSDEDKKLNTKNEKSYSINASVKLPKVSKRKPGGSGIPVVSEPNTSLGPYDDAENEDNNSNKPQIVRVVRKNKGYSPQPHTLNKETITQGNNEYSVNEKNMPTNEDLPPVNNNENES